MEFSDYSPPSYTRMNPRIKPLTLRWSSLTVLTWVVGEDNQECKYEQSTFPALRSECATCKGRDTERALVTSGVLIIYLLPGLASEEWCTQNPQGETLVYSLLSEFFLTCPLPHKPLSSQLMDPLQSLKYMNLRSYQVLGVFWAFILCKPQLVNLAS